ncbi:MAG: 50S ribosomal protein L23 [Patescibacteria group bacterium]
MNKFLIKKPIISEKSTTSGSLGTYVFLVDSKSTKPEIRKAIEAIYKVHVDAVRVLNTKPKTRVLGRSIGIKPGYKKAMVRLQAGEQLDILPHA